MDDEIAVSQEDKQEDVLDFYENIMGCDEERNYTIDLAQIGIQQHELSYLDAPFLEEEVWTTIKDMPMDKASGLDGFTDLFL